MYTAAALAATNPVLFAGEVVYESDTSRHKIGDGVKAWNALPYAGGGDFEGNIPAERVEQDGGHLFVSDTEKSTWNNKAAKDLANVSLKKSFSTNGYYKAPDGILLQWGYNTGGDSTGTITVYFPITFYAVPYCVITTVAFGAKTGVASASVNSKTASYFIARKSYAESAGAHPAGEPIYWFAIGRWK
jgi:hypothetical protein